jgi:translocation and assembly module TamA
LIGIGILNCERRPVINPHFEISNPKTAIGGCFATAKRVVLSRCLYSSVFGSLLLIAAMPAHAQYKTEITAPKPLKKLLKDFLDLSRYQDRKDLGDDQFNFMIATVAEQVTKLAATEGYFSPITTVNVDRSAKQPVVHLKVDPGKRTVVTDVALTVTGAATSQAPLQVAKLKTDWSLKTGQPFRQEDWATAKQEGLDSLARRRFAAAKLVDSQAKIDADKAQAGLSAGYESGPVFTLGALNITGTKRYPETIVRNVNPLHVGEEYSVDRLLEFQRQVLRTPYFSNVVIDIDKDPDNAVAAPVNVQVTEFPTQRIRGGVGYTTDTGAHVEGLYSNANVFGKAMVLESQIRLEQRRQFGTVTLSKPPDTSGYVDSVHVSTDRTTLAGIDLRSRRLGVRHAKETDRRQDAYTLEYYSDSLQQINDASLPTDTIVEAGTQRALVAGLEKTLRHVDSLIFPRKGYIVTGQAGVAVKGLITDQTFVRLFGRGTHYRPIGKRDVLLLRAELGAVVSRTGNSSIPASLLFRAGGTDSVRGYGYQTIGNTRNGTVYPARYLATGSVEYQHWFNEKWGSAAFYDVGAATDRWSDRKLFHAIGSGVRYRTPVGTVNADLAYGLQSKTIRPHLSLGVAF